MDGWVKPGNNGMSSSPINLFDAAIYLALFAAVVMGFMSGLLRSLATIFGYLAAAPIAVTVTPMVSRLFTGLLKLPPTQPWVEFVAVFLVAGLVMSAMCRMVVNELVGKQVSIPDRVAGGLLGAVRVVLLAVVLVLVFDRIIPAGREPAFLQGSQWRPALSRLGRQGLQSLPPDVTAYIDRMKRERGL
jgi:membrane protein required for colicin V production